MKVHRFLVFAMLPLLALGGYIAADLLAPVVSNDTPRAYRLSSEQACRLAAGCQLSHEALQVHLAMGVSGPEGSKAISLEASESLKGVAIAFGESSRPDNMQAVDGQRKWRIAVDDGYRSEVLRLVLSTGERQYFAELPLEH